MAYNKLKKWTVVGAIGLATIAGTYSFHKNDLPPFHVNKIGTSGGIAVGGIITLDKNAQFTGIAIGGFIENSGQINGLSLALANDASKDGRVNGLEVAVANSPLGRLFSNSGNVLKKVNGVQISLLNNAYSLNGIQIGGYNKADSLNGVQIGGHNEDKDKRGIFLNYNFRK